jgi:methyl coenzyme M reductase beta subunit
MLTRTAGNRRSAHGAVVAHERTRLLGLVYEGVAVLKLVIEPTHQARGFSVQLGSVVAVLPAAVHAWERPTGVNAYSAGGQRMHIMVTVATWR